MSEPAFLTLEEVMQIHLRSLAEHGGIEGTRDPGLVESAQASAKNIYYYGQGDLFDVTAGYAFHSAQSQAFLDGNKRLRWLPLWFFLPRTASTHNPPNGNFIWP